jgi:hypothetical protein
MGFLQKLEVWAGAWRILAAHPRLQWSPGTSTLILETFANTCGGVAVNSIEHGTVFIILGIAASFSRKALIGTSILQFCKHWIIKEPGTDVEAPYKSTALASDNEVGLGPSTKALTPSCTLERYEFHLEKLCERAGTFAAKDYFEHTTRRNDSHKSIVLPDSKVLGASLSEEMENSWGRAPRMSLRLHVKPISEEHTGPSGDYFGLCDIERLFHAKLAERRKRGRY